MSDKVFSCMILHHFLVMKNACTIKEFNGNKSICSERI